jgi:hypothetical protein
LQGRRSIHPFGEKVEEKFESGEEIFLLSSRPVQEHLLCCRA